MYALNNMHHLCNHRIHFLFYRTITLHYSTSEQTTFILHFTLSWYTWPGCNAVCVVGQKVSVCVCLFGCVWAKHLRKAFHHHRQPQYCGSQSHNMMTQEKESFIFEPFLNRGQLTIVCSTTWDTFLVVIDPSVYLSQLRCTFVDFDTSFCRFKSSSFCQLCKVILTESGFLHGRCWCSCAHQTKSESALSAAGSLSDT